MGTEESKGSGINNVSMDDLVWYVVVGILITLVVFALISTAGISKGSVEMRIMISVLVGIIFTISIVTSKAIKQRNDEAVQERALALTPAKQEIQNEDQGGGGGGEEKRRKSKADRKAKKEEHGEKKEQSEDEEEQSEDEDEDEEEEEGDQSDDEEEEEDGEEEEEEGKEGDDDAEAMGDDEEMEEAKKADADDVLNSRANPLAGYSRISAKAKLVARRRVKAAAEYLGREDFEDEDGDGDEEEEEDELGEGEDELGEGEEESEHASKKRKKEKRDSRKSLNAQKRMLDELLTYEGLRRIEGSTLYAREAYKDHQVDEPGEGMDQRYVDPSLLTYDSEFAAYDDAYILNPRILSVNTPMAF